jgi:hypothetical protein
MISEPRLLIGAVLVDFPGDTYALHATSEKIAELILQTDWRELAPAPPT